MRTDGFDRGGLALGFALTPIIVLGAVLRLHDLAGPSLWLDEILHFQVVQSLQGPWYRYLLGIPEIAGGTENGPLYYGLQALGQWLAPGDPGVRLLPALIGTATLPLMAVAGRLIAGRLGALVATFLLAVAPLHVYFSREGRPYALLIGLALALLVLLLEAPSRPLRWATLVVCVAGAYIGVHALPILLSFAGLVGVKALWKAKRVAADAATRQGRWFQLAAAGLALVLAWGLYLSRSEINQPVRERDDDVARVQAEVESSSWFQAPVSRRSLEQLAASMTTAGHPSVPVSGRSWVLILLALVGASYLLRRFPRDALVNVGMLVLPIAGSIAALAMAGRWYGVRYTSTALPAFLLLATAGIVAIARGLPRLLPAKPSVGIQTVARWLGAGVLVALFVAPNLGAARRDPYRKADWRGVAETIDTLALPGEAVLAANAWPEVCLGHYLRQRGRDLEIVNLWERVDLAETAVAERASGWLLTAGFRRSDELRAWMHRYEKVLSRREEELDLFFFPDDETLLTTRLEAGRGGLFEERFAARGRRIEFEATDGWLLGEGWAASETMPDGTTFQWAEGDQAALILPVGEHDQWIRLRVLPFVYPEAPRQRVTLALGDEPIGVLDLPTRWSEHQVIVPADVWRRNGPRLTLRFAHSARPADVLEGSGDTRTLSVAFDFLEVDP